MRNNFCEAVNYGAVTFERKSNARRQKRADISAPRQKRARQKRARQKRAIKILVETKMQFKL